MSMGIRWTLAYLMMKCATEIQKKKKKKKNQQRRKKIIWWKLIRLACRIEEGSNLTQHWSRKEKESRMSRNYMEKDYGKGNTFDGGLWKLMSWQKQGELVQVRCSLVGNATQRGQVKWGYQNTFKLPSHRDICGTARIIIKVTTAI